MTHRRAQLLAALAMLACTLGAFIPAAAAQGVDADPEIEAVVVQEGIRDSSTEVRAVVSALFGISAVSVAITLLYMFHTSPSRRARHGRPRARPAHRKGRELPLGLDELVPGAPPVTERSPVPVPSVASIQNVETSHG